MVATHDLWSMIYVRVVSCLEMKAGMCQSAATSLCHLHIDALWIPSSRFWGVVAGIYDKFAEAFTKAVSELHVGNGLEQGVTQVCNMHEQLHTVIYLMFICCISEYDYQVVTFRIVGNWEWSVKIICSTSVKN